MIGVLQHFSLCSDLFTVLSAWPLLTLSKRKPDSPFFSIFQRCGMVWGGGIPPEYQGWLKWPTLSFQRPHPLHPTPPSIPKQFRRSSGWSQSGSEKAGAQNHDFEVWGAGPELRVLALVSTGQGDLSRGSPTHTSAGAEPCQSVARFGDRGKWETHSPHPQLSQCCHYLPIFM